MTKPIHYCSFCGKSQREVRSLVGLEHLAMICDGCVELIVDLLREGRPDFALPSGDAPQTAVIRAVSTSPVLADALHGRMLDLVAG